MFRPQLAISAGMLTSRYNRSVVAAERRANARYVAGSWPEDERTQIRDERHVMADAFHGKSHATLRSLHMVFKIS